MTAPRAIAIVGRAGRFPQAADVETLWANVLARRSAVRDVRPERWPVTAADMLNAHGAPDRARSGRAALLEPLEFTATGLDLPDALLARLSPLNKLTLQVGWEAWVNAGGPSLADATRAGVILANIALPTDGASALAEAAVLGGLDDLPDRATTTAEPLNRYTSALPAGLLARGLGLKGPSFTLDAACASSLYAIHLACAELEAGRLDVVLAGGVSLPQALYTQVGFTQLQALSPSGVCAPFDKHADGLVVGEGAGVFVLRRLEDAERDGARIWGVIRGIGLSNDVGGSLLSPEQEGQLRAMRAAYAQAGWSPADVQLVECHGTGTPRGDAVELSSIAKLFGPSPAVIGSVKSNVGHLLTAAGSAALCKVLSAIDAKTLPPSANHSAATQVDALGGSTLRMLEAPEPWVVSGAPRRAAVSGFGFGGINAHVLVEEYVAAPARKTERQRARAPDIAVVGLASHFGGLTTAEALQHAWFNGRAIRTERPAARWPWPAPVDAQVTGSWLDSFELPLGRFKIPPRELTSILPQQLLMLKVAADALDDANVTRATAQAPHLDMGAVIGLGLDLETTTFHLRWVTQSRMRAYIQQRRLDVSEAELNDWVTRVCDRLGPPLDSTRTLGALGGIVPSRIAREFFLGGPSFAVSSEESSGLRALEVAARFLQRGEARVMLAGAVDLTGDLRQVLATNAVRPYSKKGHARPFDEQADGPTLAEGAAAVVLKRLDDAMADNDRVYSVVRGFGSAGGVALKSGTARVDALTRSMRSALAEAQVDAGSVTVHVAHGSGAPDEDRDEATALQAVFARGAVTSVAGVIGHSGAASGLASFVGASLSLFHELVAPMPGIESAIAELGTALHVPQAPQVWLRNRVEGPRRAGVTSFGVDGSATHVVVEGVERGPSEETASRARPLGSRQVALFTCGADEVDSLRSFAPAAPAEALGDVEVLASAWFRRAVVRGPTTPTRAFVATSRDDLVRQLGRPPSAAPTRLGGDVAFVFPGSGNHFIGMGRSLGVALPEVYRALDAEVGELEQQLMPRWVTPWRQSWGPAWPSEAAQALAAAPERMILSQVAHGLSVSDALRRFGVKPDAYLGYSLGESAALFASRTWRDRDLMFHRTSESPLFRTELAGANDVVYRAWGARDWHVVIVNRSANHVRERLQGTAALLIVNAPNECVIGGRRPDVERTVAQLGCEALEIEGVPTVHLPVMKAVASEYRALHELPSTPPEGVRFYSAAWGRAYTPTTANAADSILANAQDGFDFQKVVEQAWADGVRVFVEGGPQGSCSRMIARILAGRPHLAVSACQRGPDGFTTLLQALAKLVEAGVAVDLTPLYGPGHGISVEPNVAKPSTRVSLARQMPPRPPRPCSQTATSVAAPSPRPPPPLKAPSMPHDPVSPATSLFLAAEASAAAHEAYLAFAQQATSLQLQLLAEQQQLGERTPLAQQPAPPASTQPAPAAGALVAFDRAQCLEFATGAISNVLGSDFAAVDAHPTRVRLPDEPLMLVDRIMLVEGTKGLLGPGRVVTEHDVREGAWYLDGGRAPVCISVEAGQADLFLSGYLGIDFKTRGERVYRLLDAKITFHRDLPRANETIRYDIRIDRFIQQGDTWLFFFRFDGTIDGRPFITMFDGCAGFFSDEQLRTGRGIVAENHPQVAPTRRANTEPFRQLVTFAPHSLDASRVEALRRGDLATAFGADFNGKALVPALRLPSGRMRLVDRITELSQTGGAFGLGVVYGEADIAPDDWFLTCHFTDDPVMPGTLMYECCLHTLRVWLLRQGWVTDDSSLDVHFSPIEGQASRLRCRGQVLQTTKTVGYRIDIKEIGYDPEPYVIAHASMFADGRHIVEMEGMSVRLRGLRREQLEAQWAATPTTTTPTRSYSRAQILAYAEGNPSEGFGEPYRPFDRDRRLARLPRPPFLFLDRVLSVDAEPWVLAPGGWVEGAFDVAPDAWFFAAHGQNTMPFAVLLEAALQPCGWLAAYAGSALTSERDLHFRNLDGTATQYLEVTPDVGTLTTRARMTKTSQAGGMILQEFEMEVLARGQRVYAGRTGFGFFPSQALAQQVGIRSATLRPSGGHGFDLPRTPPLTPSDRVAPAGPRYGGLALPSGALSMVDRIDSLQLDGGLHGFGFVTGSKTVDPAEWFFDAHFYQDPVMPGSLGLEALVQLLKVYARERYGKHVATHRFEAMALGRQHTWQYRGQVIPTNARVDVQADITQCADDLVVADGVLSVDGRVIYAMKQFALRLVPEPKP